MSEAGGYAERAGARFFLMEGSDHFFTSRENDIASVIEALLLGRG